MYGFAPVESQVKQLVARGPVQVEHTLLQLPQAYWPSWNWLEAHSAKHSSPTRVRGDGLSVVHDVQVVESKQVAHGKLHLTHWPFEK